MNWSGTSYELKLMVLNGEYPQVFACGGCGTKEDLRYFSVEESSVFCGGCGAARRRKIPLSPSLLYTIQYVIAAPLEKLYLYVYLFERLRETVHGLKDSKVWKYWK